MTKRIFNLASGITLITLFVLLLANCTKDDSFIAKAENELTSESPVVPIEVATYLSEAEMLAFYDSKPTHLPASAGVELRSDKTWHPFFASGDVGGFKYPLLGYCDNPPIANICPAAVMCQDPSAFTGYAVMYAGKAMIEGYGQVNQFYSNFVCGVGTPVEDGIHNSSFKRGVSNLHLRAVGNEFTKKVNNDGTVTVDWAASICNAASPNDGCWDYSSGDFKGVQGEGTINCRLITKSANIPASLFDELKPGKLISWGWLYY